jgi:hypothetical protein
MLEPEAPARACMILTQEFEEEEIRPQEFFEPKPTFEVNRNEVRAKAFELIKKTGAQYAHDLIVNIAKVEEFDKIPEDQLCRVYDALVTEIEKRENVK